MNTITIYTLDDLRMPIEAPFYISGKESDLEKEIEYNMWCIGFSDAALANITIADLLKFFDAFLQQKLRQLKLMYPLFQATFYAWFDRQALQLRFNILSGNVISLPFSCQVRVIDSLQPIVQNFITTTLNTMHNGDVIEVLTPEDPRWDDDEEETFVLDVYVKVLQ